MNKFRLLFSLTLLYAGATLAQISEGGLPLSLQDETSGALNQTTLETIQLPALDITQARAQDDKYPYYPRFAAPVPADISTLNTGAWTILPNGDQVWRCAIQSPGALALILLFDQFTLPEGSTLYAYTPDGQHIRGAYTRKSGIPSGEFTIGPLPGDIAVLEYRARAGASQTESPFHLNRVDYAYRKEQLDGPEDFGDALACHINVNCPLGANWQTEKKGIGRILMVFSNGAGWCSGAMIANTAGTGEPYFLSAHHCQLIGTSPNFNQWVFDFDYEAIGCSNPGAEPAAKSVLGCQRIAFRAETDVMLLKLNPIPANYGVYFNGWNRTNNATVSRSTFIHHPKGDIKKISADTNAAIVHPQTLNWGGVFGISPANTHWKVVPDHGTFEPGSSGSPLFDQNKRIVGQLHGGSWNTPDPSCTATAVYFGMFNLSWDQGTTPDSRLREWLDPGNTGANTQNGYAQPAPSGVTISGNIKSHWGINMADVRVVISGGASDTVTTDASGNYTFTNVPVGQNYTITPIFDFNDLNGVTTFDLVLISKHLLGLEPLNSPWKIIAGDANKSNTVTTFDIVEIRKVILGLNPSFPAVNSWRFFPANSSFPEPTNPFSGTFPTEFITLSNVQANASGINFFGVKVGDTNSSAAP
jgi:lysyl endopeptidase